ncbi:MAG: DUF5340 domain-containing protein [Chroococcidiopsidaceae cyanobacterium CP_BM_RX_35]|nr:DUF5340 domain-containing protein [Chroococcidiopsidaceae cyanobacterium CP_BM_RX_35]
MEPILLPSPIHYELLLQLLERQTMVAVNHDSALRAQVSQLIITLRKAAAQQKQLEERCRQSQVPVDHRWSINHHTAQQVTQGSPLGGSGDFPEQALPGYLPLSQGPPG